MEKGSSRDLKVTLTFFKSELDRVQTIVGTLSEVEGQHHKALTNFGDNRLNELAKEEQSAARQLGEVKQICMALSQKVGELQEQYRES